MRLACLRYGGTVMTEFDLFEDVPLFAAYALPPGEFPGFSGGSYGGSMLGTEGIANVEYLYRPDYDSLGRMVGVSSTRPTDGNELLHEDPMWWASGRVRVNEILMGDFPLNAGVVAPVGARYMGEAMVRYRGPSLPTPAMDDASRACVRGLPICGPGPRPRIVADTVEQQLHRRGSRSARPSPEARGPRSS
jgi:hypothetical protein